jgi:hypothetical protein
MRAWKSYLPVIISTIALSVVAIWNAFPLMHADTSTFLVSGFELETPFDRPISYGILLRIFSLNGLFIWLVVILQSFLVSWLSLRLFHSAKDHDKWQWFGALALTCSVLFSTLSWNTSLLTPDIFSAIAALALINLLVGKSSKKITATLYLIFLVSVSTHLGHISYFIVFIALLALLKLIKSVNALKAVRWQKLAVLFSLTCLSILTMGSAMAKSKNGFFLAAMLENGVLLPYLDEACETQDYEICKYKDELPQKAWEFLWVESSPFYKMGDWKGSREEFGEIISETLTNPKYIALHIQCSLKASLKQAVTFGVADGTGAFGEETELNQRIHTYLPNSVSAFEYSRQYKDQLKGMEWLNRFLMLTTICFALISLAWFLRWKLLSETIQLTLLLMLIALLLNVWVSGTFGNAIPRLGGKMIWFLPIIAFLGLKNKIQQSEEIKN